MQKNKIVFLIRAYNEATRITQVIDDIFAAGYEQILVVDDGSTDGTETLLARLIHDKKINFVRHATNRGAGAALETGFAYIRSAHEQNHWKYLVTFDADGQHDVQDMEHFISAFKDNEDLDVVLGSRFIKKTKTNVPFLRRLILLGGRIFTSIIS
jgi:glycosyltransferase involved in cell wall biosynthesis